MKGSLKIGTVAGIGIYLHWTFGLLIVGIFALYLVQGSTLGMALIGLGLLLTVFACVVLHELGHALMARRFAVPTHSITLYPIGGLARLDRIPEEPMEEFWIAVAGPAVNVAIAAVLGVLLVVAGGPLSPMTVLQPDGGHFLATLLWLNVVLVLFNLLPAFPMDGGRILRALLATRLDYAEASQIAASIGQAMAILFGIVGLFINPFLIIIGLFVYFGAQQESQQAMMRAVTRGIPVRQVMLTRFATLAPGDTLGVAVDALLSGSDQDFPVVRDGQVVGVLTRKVLMQALAEADRTARVSDVVAGGCLTVDDTTMLDVAFATMSTARCSTLPVLRGGRLVGLLTLENVGELIMISSALRRSGHPEDLDAVLAAHGAASQ